MRFLKKWGDKMAITVGTDTYISLSDATAYVNATNISTSTNYITWTALTDGNKEVYLKLATKKIDRQYLRGIKSITTQTLEFPRALQTDYRRQDYPNLNILLDGEWFIEIAVDQRVKDAQVEEALSIAVNGGTANKRAELQAQGVTEFSLGKLSEKYDNGTNTTGSTKLLSVNAQELLRYYILGGVAL